MIRTRRRVIRIRISSKMKMATMMTRSPRDWSAFVRQSRKRTKRHRESPFNRRKTPPRSSRWVRRLGRSTTRNCDRSSQSMTPQWAPKPLSLFCKRVRSRSLISQLNSSRCVCLKSSRATSKPAAQRPRSQRLTSISTMRRSRKLNPSPKRLC